MWQRFELRSMRACQSGYWRDSLVSATPRSATSPTGALGGMTMLKMVGAGKRGSKNIQIVVFGLSHTNLDRLREGQPIHFPGEDVGIENVEIMIFAGESEQSMQRELAELIGPKTQTKIDPRF